MSYVFDENTTWFRGKTKRDIYRYYRLILPRIRTVARKSGYAITVHGSMKRDLDLVAVPWVRRHLLPITLVRRIQREITGFVMKKKDYHWTMKPNGRQSVVINIGTYVYIDLSFVCVKKYKNIKYHKDVDWRTLRKLKKTN